MEVRATHLEPDEWRLAFRVLAPQVAASLAVSLALVPRAVRSSPRPIRSTARPRYLRTARLRYRRHMNCNLYHHRNYTLCCRGPHNLCRHMTRSPCHARPNLSVPTATTRHVDGILAHSSGHRQNHRSHRRGRRAVADSLARDPSTSRHNQRCIAVDARYTKPEYALRSFRRTRRRCHKPRKLDPNRRHGRAVRKGPRVLHSQETS